MIADESMHEYLGLTALEWGVQFYDRAWVNTATMALLDQRVSSD